METKTRAKAPRHPAPTPDHKWCARCDDYLPMEDFQRNRSRPDGRQNYCREHQNHAVSIYKIRKIAEDPMWTRRVSLKTLYDITLEEFDALLLSQGSCCAICGRDTPGTKRKQWHVDHCHRRDKVRGVLCHHCNVLLGNAKDSWIVLLNAIHYLFAHEEETHESVPAV